MGKDKRMDAFARETFKFGTLRGFRHFKAELRGREEMMLNIEVPASNANRLHQLKPMMTHQNTLPPASPCQREGSPAAPWKEDNGSSSKREAVAVQCSFLVAGYAHYNCPLAWVRSGHRLFGANFSSPTTMDSPIELDASREWTNRAVHAFEFGASLRDPEHMRVFFLF